jgi:hypothetical protein
MHRKPKVKPQVRLSWGYKSGINSREKVLKIAESADKPGSVLGNHSSGTCVTAGLKRPTRTRRGPRQRVPIWSCSRWGLPCRSVARLAVRSYRTVSPLPRTLRPFGGLLSVALSVGSRRPGVTWHLALWSPDFPPPRKAAVAWPTPRARVRPAPTEDNCGLFRPR